jgi:hypothetical protein
VFGRRWLGPRLEALRRGVVQFVGEQDGDVEKELKNALGPVLSKYDVKRAYLPRVKVGKEPGVGVALCLAGRKNMSLVREAAEVFRASFASDVHLDILFLDGKTQEKDLSRVCKPFYGA